MVQAPGKPPEKSSLSGAAEGEVGRDGGPSVTGEGRESARERAASAREARNQVVPRICIRPEPEGLGRFSFLGKGIMVFCVRGTLLEEDRAAWRRLKAQRERAARKKHQKAVRGWFGDKLCGFGIMMYGILALCLAIYDGMRIGGTICGLLMTFGGLWMFVSLGRRPVRETAAPPGQDFPPSGMPDTPVRAAFFGDGCFAFWDASGKVRLGYSSIAAAWEDEGRFYLFFQNRPPLVLPKRGFSGGEPEAFRNFLEGEQDVPVERMG